MDAAGEDGHTVLPENTVVEVVGEGENNDLEVSVSPLSDVSFWNLIMLIVLTSVDVAGEGGNNDLVVIDLQDVGEDEHTVLPENPVAEVVGEGENNDLRVSVSPLSDVSFWNLTMLTVLTSV
jgi:hypothetical protein